MCKIISISEVLSTISNEKSLLLFNTVALSNSESSSDILITKLNLTRKQYYSRISKLVKADLVIKVNRKYFLTSFGKIVYNAQTTIGEAVSNYWKLKAVDSLEISGQLSNEEYHKIINALIENEKVKEALIIKSHRIATNEFTDRRSNRLPDLQKSIHIDDNNVNSNNGDDNRQCLKNR